MRKIIHKVAAVLAFIFVCHIISLSSLMAQASQLNLSSHSVLVTQESYPIKDPQLAALLSLILPGGGEFYLRNDLKAISFFLATSAAYILSFYFVYLAISQPGSSSKSNLIIGGVSFVTGLLIHIFGIVSSYNDAVKINEIRQNSSFENE